MENHDLVSVIIPCYNQAQYLEEAVQSAVDQTYPDIEIIIINDGSPDNTQEIAEKLQEKYPEKIRIISQKNQGVSEARNNGIRNAFGEYIVPLDADDKLHKDMVTKCLNKIQQNNADIVYTGYQGFGTSDRSNMWEPFEKTNPLYSTPCSPTALYKKKVWTTTGGYSSIMHDGYEDWEYWVNAYKHDMKFIHIPKKLYFYRIKEESRDTEAVKKDTYLKAKIVLIHQEAYTVNQVEAAKEIIKATEDLADVYFYTPQNVHDVNRDIIQSITHCLSNNTLSDIDYVVIEEQNIKLYAMDNIKNFKAMQKILKKNDPKKILFYTPMHYEIPELNNCNFAWENGAMTKAKGTLFPYVFKEVRENTKSQLLAYQRLEKYHEYIADKLNNLQRKYDNDQKNAARKLRELQNKYNTLDQKYNTLDQKYNSLMESLSEITKSKTLKAPFKKISAYKKLLALYHKYR